MKMLGTLIKNELIKLLSRKSVVVIFCIILGITVIFSLLDDRDFIGERYQKTDNVIKNYMRYETNDNYTDDINEKTLLNAIKNSGVSILKEAKNAGVLTTEDWRYPSVCDLQELEAQNLTINMFLNGSIDFSLLSRYTNCSEHFDEESIKQTVKENESKAAELRDAIIRNDYTDVYRNSLLVLQNKHKDDVIYYRQALSEALPEDALKFKELFSVYEYYQSEAESLLEKAISEGYTKGSSECKEIEGAVASLNRYNGIINQTFSRTEFEKEIKKNGYFSLNFDNGSELRLEEYGEYLDAYKDALYTFYEPLTVCRYAIENDVSEMTSQDSTRLNLLSVRFIFFLFAFFGIFVASGSISGEFSKKTINTLIIKPASRAKIFASKYISAVTVSLSSMFICVLAAVIFSSVRYGFTDIFSPYIYISAHEAHEIPFLLWFLYRTLIAGVGVLFLTTLSFFFSALTKNTAASILCTFGIYSALNLCSVFAPLIFGFAALRFLITNYITIWNNAYTNYVSLGQESLFNNIGNYLYGSQTDLLVGTLILLVLAVIMYTVSLWTFKRKDVV